MSAWLLTRFGVLWSHQAAVNRVKHAPFLDLLKVALKGDWTNEPTL